MLENPFLRWTESVYGFLIRIATHLQSLFLLYMRVTWGHQFFLTGVSKFRNIDATAELFGSLNIPSPFLSGYTVAVFEVLCGFLIFIGFGSRLAAIPMMVILLVALSTAHAPAIGEWRFLLEPLSLVREAPYPYLMTAVSVFVFGPGRVSFDAWLKRWSKKLPRY